MTASLMLDGGWLISNAVLARADRPYAIAVSVSPAGEAASAEAFAQADRGALREAPGYEPISDDAIDVDGGRVAVHRYRWGQNGSTREQARFYGFRSGVVYALTASEAPPAEDERELAAMVAALRIDPRRPVDLSQEELWAIAELAGIPAFPGLEDREAPGEEVRLAARRALVARGALVADGDRVTLDRDTGALVRAVLTAPGMIAIQRRTRGGREGRLLHLSPLTGVRQYEAAPGVHRLEPFSPSQVPAAIATTAGLTGVAAAGGGPITLSRAAYQALREHGTVTEGAERLAEVTRSFVASVDARVLRRDGQRVVGGEVDWIDAGPAGLWAVERSGDDVTLTPEDGAGILRRISARLGGDQSAAT